MSNQKFPTYGEKSKQYLFKKNLPLRRKSRLKLLRESLLMITVSLLIFFINFLFLQKKNYLNLFLLI